MTLKRRRKREKIAPRKIARGLLTFWDVSHKKGSGARIKTHTSDRCLLGPLSLIAHPRGEIGEKKENWGEKERTSIREL